MDIDIDILRELASITSDPGFADFYDEDDLDPYPCKVCGTVTEELDFTDSCARCAQERAERIAAPLN